MVGGYALRYALGYPDVEHADVCWGQDAWHFALQADKGPAPDFADGSAPTGVGVPRLPPRVASAMARFGVPRVRRLPLAGAGQVAL
jgi:hypothetical protein